MAGIVLDHRRDSRNHGAGCTRPSKKITRYVDSGADEVVTLLETTGTYSDTITLPDGGNYVGIECEEFTGNIELNIEYSLAV